MNFIPDTLLQATTLVAFAEIGDKTQLLSVLLAARYRKFWPLFFGILVATILNHAAAAYIGTLLNGLAGRNIIMLVSGIAFIALGLWILIPDKEPDEDEKMPKYGAFLTTVILFFIAEMGDKTQLATVTLGAESHDLLQVTIGTTLGMMIANVPALLFGDVILKKIPLNVVRIISSVLFVAYGIYILIKQFMF